MRPPSRCWQGGEPQPTPLCQERQGSWALLCVHSPSYPDSLPQLLRYLGVGKGGADLHPPKDARAEMRQGWTLSPLTSVPVPWLYLFTSDLSFEPPGPGIPQLSCVLSQPHAPGEPGSPPGAPGSLGQLPDVAASQLCPPQRALIYHGSLQLGNNAPQPSASGPRIPTRRGVLAVCCLLV